MLTIAEKERIDIVTSMRASQQHWKVEETERNLLQYVGMF